MLIEIRKKPFNAWQEVASYAVGLQLQGQLGAVVSFVGCMRDFNDGKQVTALFLEHYPEMTKKQLGTIARVAKEKWQLLDLLILHRIGKLEIADDIVLVVTCATHRKVAFESCRMIMEELKSTAPFWKKEETVDGSRWVEKNTEGF